MLRIGWFSTGRGKGSQNLLRTAMEKRDQGILDIDVRFVFCNWNPGEDPDNPYAANREVFFDMVRNYGIPLVTLSWKQFRPELRSNAPMTWRDEYGQAMRGKLEAYGIDIGVLAGYMLWIDDVTCEVFDLINLHPALPWGPKGTWEEVIWELMATDVKEQGAMIHLTTPEWDRGPALTYCRFPITGPGYDELWVQFKKKLGAKGLDEIKKEEGMNEPLFKRIREEGARRELPLVVYSIKLLADGQVSIKDGGLVANGTPPCGSNDLSAEVDAALERGEF